jgi:predicted N-formylglutamate amidohydrolase
VRATNDQRRIMVVDASSIRAHCASQHGLARPLALPLHGERLPHVTFEVRQDRIATRDTAEPWAQRLAGVLREPPSDRKLYVLNRS